MSLGFWHPAHLIATWGGAGLLKPAPGSWGSRRMPVDMRRFQV